jgi:hypothetical protein
MERLAPQQVVAIGRFRIPRFQKSENLQIAMPVEIREPGRVGPMVCHEDSLYWITKSKGL